MNPLPTPTYILPRSSLTEEGEADLILQDLKEARVPIPPLLIHALSNLGKDEVRLTNLILYAAWAASGKKALPAVVRVKLSSDDLRLFGVNTNNTGRAIRRLEEVGLLESAHPSANRKGITYVFNVRGSETLGEMK